MQIKNQFYSSCFPWDIAKILHAYNLEYFKHAWLHTSKVSNLYKTFVFICRQKTQLHPQCFSWRYCKDIQTSHFGYFGHALLRTHKIIVSPWRKLQYLSPCQKWTLSLNSFLRYFILKNLAIWLANSNLAHNSRTRILPHMGLVVKYQ